MPANIQQPTSQTFLERFTRALGPPIEDLEAREEWERAEYRRVFNQQLDCLLDDPALVKWLDTPIRRRPHNPHLSKWQVYNLQMRLEAQRLSRTLEALQALQAAGPEAESEDDPPPPPLKRSRIRAHANADERRN